MLWVTINIIYIYYKLLLSLLNLIFQKINYYTGYVRHRYHKIKQ